MSGAGDNQKPPPANHPPGHWLWGSLREFRRDTLGTMTDWVRRYGAAFTSVNRQFREFTFHPLGLLLVRLDFLPATHRFNHHPQATLRRCLIIIHVQLVNPRQNRSESRW